jgi:hypothetical protein
MPQGTQRPPIREEDRIKALERQVKSLERTVANLLKAKPRTHWRQIEFARTVEDPDAVPTYPVAATQDYPIRFVDMESSAGTNRSAGMQAYAHAPLSVLIPVDSLLVVKQTRKGKWAIVNIVPEDGCNPFLGWINAGGVPVDSEPSYVLSLSAAGCLRKTAVGDCDEE